MKKLKDVLEANENLLSEETLFDYKGGGDPPPWPDDDDWDDSPNTCCGCSSCPCWPN